MKNTYSLVIIGGGPAGLAAAVSAYDAGLQDILILERDNRPGGILRQCIHNGFGLHRFGEELTGPEYAGRYIDMVKERNIPILTEATVTGLDSGRHVTVTHPTEGIFTLNAGAVILAMGCRERPRGALNIPGTRPAGIFTAGAAQKFVNRMGYLPGREVVILGSGDIGLIMARRMTLEGAKVKAVCELLPYSGGLARNIEQCLHDFDIPLYLSHTVTAVHGKERVTGVTVSRVDEHRHPIPGTEMEISCDTLLLSCGLIPENELTKKAGIPLDRVTGGAVVDETRETAIPGVFACGNVLHVHDLVDFVSEEAAIAGRAAAEYVRSAQEPEDGIALVTDGKIRYTVPQKISGRQSVKIYFRVSENFRNKVVTVKDGEKVLFSVKKEKLAPGEMETVLLSEKVLSGITGKVLTVSLEEPERKEG